MREWLRYHLATGDELVALFPGHDEHKQAGRCDAARMPGSDSVMDTTFAVASALMRLILLGNSER